MSKYTTGRPATERSRSVRKWETTNWPDKDGGDRVLVRAAKVGEEAGEILGAVIKMGEGRLGLDDLLKEIGDVQITLHALAAELDVDLDEIASLRWEEVRHRVEHHARNGSPCECGHQDHAHRTSSSFPTSCRYCDCEKYALPGTSWLDIHQGATP